MRNDPGGGNDGGFFSWDQFDALPRKLRELLANSPICGATDDISKALRDGLSVDEIITIATQYLDEYLPQLSTETYGPEYPCQTYSYLTTSRPSSATRRSHTSGARSARAARPSTRAQRRLYWPA